MNLQGLLLGLLTFLLIGAFHPIVIKTEYYFGTRPWPVFLIVGAGCCVAALLLADLFWSTLLAIIGFCAFWSIGELFEQKERVRKGWFPKNPRRHD
ncbi:MAG: DUF4491 family protein [Bacteroidaceae bacterium]|nr:DUF4491 family protein [Candidatus Equimonas faecalis]MCQ2205498.1 DUF4491 family protein [Bacteroidaceae bacterium]